MSPDEAMARLRVRQEDRRREASTRPADLGPAAPAATRPTSRPAPTSRAADDIPLANRRILAFARKNVGTQVGNGECWTLAHEALQAAGIRRPDTYVWGRPLAPAETVLPGDVLQFESVRLEKGDRWLIVGTPRHTAIVVREGMPGVIVALHQNFAGSRVVHEMVFDLTTKTAGDVVVYRPGEGEARPGRWRRGRSETRGDE